MRPDGFEPPTYVIRRQIVRIKGKGLVEAPPKTESGVREIVLPPEMLEC